MFHRSRYGRRAACALAFAAAAAGCTTETKKEAAKSAISTMSTEQRRHSFEATARMLDEDPRLVDELYSVARGHPKMMHRFLANASRDLEQPWLANMTAELLAKHPASVEQTLLSATDAIAKEPEARKAMNRAVARRSDTMVDILTDDAPTLGAVVRSSLAFVQKKPRARQNVIAAVRQNRKQVIELVKSDPELSKELTEELLREAVKDKPALEKVLRATGAIDDDGHGAKKGKSKR